ncbi:MAG TPA: MMPL family transporter, partial [Micromonosporaceae bacterium]|nr:MMPL family transporter [Micromonosporaceae bacterium]
MLTTLATVATRWRRQVLMLTGALVVVAAIVSAPAMNVLSNGGFRDPGSESARAGALLDDRFAAGDVNYVLLATAPAGIDAPDAAAAGRDLAGRLARQPGVTRVTSYWDPPDPALRS